MTLTVDKTPYLDSTLILNLSTAVGKESCPAYLHDHILFYQVTDSVYGTEFLSATPTNSAILEKDNVLLLQGETFTKQ